MTMPESESLPPEIPATQVDRPWRATFRTTVAAAFALLPILPYVATSARIETVPAVASILAIAAAITRVAAVPQVEDWLERYVPGLAAEPKRKEITSHDGISYE